MSESLEATIRYQRHQCTTLWKHLSNQEAETTTVEYTDNRGCRYSEPVRFAGCMVGEVDPRAEGKEIAAANSNAALRLALQIDDALFFGSGEESQEFTGLSKFAELGRIDSLPSSQFYERYLDERESRGLRLFTGHRAEHVDEGSLPSRGRTFAISPQALVWRQLMPAMRIPIASLDMATGALWPPLAADDPPAADKPQDEMLLRRVVVVVYGCLELHDPATVFALE